jgi:hypothetical protein
VTGEKIGLLQRDFNVGAISRMNLGQNKRRLKFQAAFSNFIQTSVFAI